jgi:hypothetical protein
MNNNRKSKLGSNENIFASYLTAHFAYIKRTLYFERKEVSDPCGTIMATSLARKKTNLDLPAVFLGNLGVIINTPSSVTNKEPRGIAVESNDSQRRSELMGSQDQRLRSTENRRLITGVRKDNSSSIRGGGIIQRGNAIQEQSACWSCYFGKVKVRA